MSEKQWAIVQANPVCPKCRYLVNYPWAPAGTTDEVEVMCNGCKEVFYCYLWIQQGPKS